MSELDIAADAYVRAERDFHAHEVKMDSLMRKKAELSNALNDARDKLQAAYWDVVADARESLGGSK